MNLIPHYKTSDGFITVGIDFHSLERYYGIKTAVKMYIPMYRTITRLLTKATSVLHVSRLKLLEDIRSRLIVINDDKVYPIPVKYISYTEDLIDEEWIPHEDDDIPMLFDQTIIQLHPSLLTLINPVTRGNFIIGCDPSKDLSDNRIVSIHLISEDVELDIPYRVKYGVKVWDTVENAVRYYISRKISSIILYTPIVIINDNVVNHLTDFTYLLNKLDDTVYVDGRDYDDANKFDIEDHVTGLTVWKSKINNRVSLPIEIFDITSSTQETIMKLIEEPQISDLNDLPDSVLI